MKFKSGSKRAPRLLARRLDVSVPGIFSRCTASLSLSLSFSRSLSGPSAPVINPSNFNVWVSVREQQRSFRKTKVMRNNTNTTRTQRNSVYHVINFILWSFSCTYYSMWLNVNEWRWSGFNLPFLSLREAFVCSHNRRQSVCFKEVWLKSFHKKIDLRCSSWGVIVSKL